MTTWILVGDASRARLFAARTRRRFTLLKQFEHPEGRRPGRDLVSDRPGRLQQRRQASIRSAAEPRTEAHEIEVGRFAATLANELRQGLDRNAYQELVLAAPPHFLGRLRAQLEPRVARRITASIAKDLTARDERGLRDALAEQLSTVSLSRERSVLRGRGRGWQG